jgi:hypothetical protein
LFFSTVSTTVPSCGRSNGLVAELARVEVERAAVVDRVRADGQGFEHQEISLAHRRRRAAGVAEDPRRRRVEAELRRLEP